MNRKQIQELNEAFREVDRAKDHADSAVRRREDVRDDLHRHHRWVVEAEEKLQAARLRLQDLVDKFGIEP